MGELLARDSPPVWVAQAWTNARGALRDRLRELAVARRADVVGTSLEPSGDRRHTPRSWWRWWSCSVAARSSGSPVQRVGHR